MPTSDFKVRSLESIGTWQMDADVGVVRIGAALLKQTTKRNSLVRITVMAGEHRGNSIVRLVRAATSGQDRSALKGDEIALQYDDRLQLGINNVGMIHELKIEPVGDWCGLASFLLRHTSPLVRIQSLFALALMVFGAVAGFVLGLAFNWVLTAI